MEVALLTPKEGTFPLGPLALCLQVDGDSEKVFSDCLGWMDRFDHRKVVWHDILEAFSGTIVIFLSLANKQTPHSLFNVFTWWNQH